MNKDKQSSFADLLEKILYDYAEFPDEFDRHRCHKAILDLVKSELVPDEYVVGSRTSYEEGFNKCRQEILDKLGN